MKEQDENARFTIHDEKEAVPEALYVTDAENLRLEKLSTRITLVSVLIPCLLVIILAVAYLDIKNRVVSTQTTGSMGVQNLSKDLESRFSSLSLKQAKLEEQLDANTKTLETSTASLQVHLKKAISEIKGKLDDKADRSALAAQSKKTQDALAALQKAVNDLNADFAKFDEELAGQISVMAEGMKKDQDRLAAVEQKAQKLDAEKLTRESMNLSLGLERLALQELVKDNIREIGKRLAAMDKRIDALNQQIEAQAKPAASPSRPSATRPAPAAPSRPSPAPSSGTSTIEEQTIK